MSIGVCYFPEHWPREGWEHDVDLMADAGIDRVRMGEFAWGVIEPSRGEFHVEWLESVLDLLGDRGMGGVLCTPTAAPPKWLIDERPEILQEESDGTVREWGSRRTYCFNSAAYRHETRRIVDRLADRFADHPHVVGWQTDNEYGCHGTTLCYCEDCARAFREWLAAEYGDVEALNAAWGNAFWSQQYGSFAAVDPPRHTPSEHHPSRYLDYRRFTSDAIASYNRLQAERLRAANDDWFVTHNFMSHYAGFDAYDLAEGLDFAAWDSYPTGHPQGGEEMTASGYRAGDPDITGLDHDVYRSLLDRPFWVMEQQPGDINWPPHSPQPAEGAMRLWAHHAVAHGADRVMYFRWRRCREGQEQYHAGLLDHDGSPGRGFEDARLAAEELDEIGELGHVDAPVAIIHDYDNLWATDAEPHSPDYDYWSHLETYYRALRARGVMVDVVPPGRSLDGYGAVVATTPYLVDDEFAVGLSTYVEEGGELLLTIRAGVADRHDKLLNEPAPGPLVELAGATVDERETLPDSMDTQVEYDGDEYEFRTWAEWLSPGVAGVAGEHRSGVAAGRPAITLNERDGGSVLYCGVWPDAELADALVVDLLSRGDVDTTPDPLPVAVRVAERNGLTWVTNFSDAPVTVDAPDSATFELGGPDVDAYDLAVVDVPAADLLISEA